MRIFAPEVEAKILRIRAAKYADAAFAAVQADMANHSVEWLNSEIAAIKGHEAAILEGELPSFEECLQLLHPHKSAKEIQAEREAKMAKKNAGKLAREKLVQFLNEINAATVTELAEAFPEWTKSKIRYHLNRLRITGICERLDFAGTASYWIVKT